MTTKLHIGNMPRNSTRQEIEGLFRPFGLVASVAMMKDPVTGENTGCGTVEMDNESDARSAISRLNFSQFGGRTIGVSRKRDPQVDQQGTSALIGLETLIEEKYGIVSVEPVEPPRGMVGTGWHCYVIEQGKNNIRGYRQGSIDSVTQAVEEIVFRLNERRRGKFGRVHLTMSSHAKKSDVRKQGE